MLPPQFSPEDEKPADDRYDGYADDYYDRRREELAEELAQAARGDHAC